MNVRLLRASERTRTGGRLFRGMGQMQPVLIGSGRYGLELRIEGVDGTGRPCWQIFPLPRFREQAKRVFAELEACNREGRASPAKLAWEACKREAEVADNRPTAAPGLTSYRYQGSFGWIMIGARDHADALSQAARSLSHGIAATIDRLQIWNGRSYVPAESAAP